MDVLAPSEEGDIAGIGGEAGSSSGHFVVSLNKGTPAWTQKYCNPYHSDPQNVGTSNFGKSSFVEMCVPLSTRTLSFWGGKLMCSKPPLKW